MPRLIAILIFGSISLILVGIAIVFVLATVGLLGMS
jgi:hypothetical protein